LDIKKVHAKIAKIRKKSEVCLNTICETFQIVIYQEPLKFGTKVSIRQRVRGKGEIGLKPRILLKKA
jgi:hypothetical protein